MVTVIYDDNDGDGNDNNNNNFIIWDTTDLVYDAGYLF